jgi:hypothetical protein
MMEAEEEECHDHYYVGGTEEDVDESMLDSLFKLSAYLGFNDNNNNDIDDEESDNENNVIPTQLPAGGGQMVVAQEVKVGRISLVMEY